jgi:hypothetical protein
MEDLALSLLLMLLDLRVGGVVLETTFKFLGEEGDLILRGEVLEGGEDGGDEIGFVGDGDGDDCFDCCLVRA